MRPSLTDSVSCDTVKKLTAFCFYRLFLTII